MLFSGLKMKIAATLAVLLSLAILLGNIVVIAFWQKRVVRSEIEQVRSVLQSIKSPEHLKEFCKYTGSRCLGVILFQRRTLVDGRAA